jgi:hypothetical protein
MRQQAGPREPREVAKHNINSQLSAAPRTPRGVSELGRATERGAPGTAGRERGVQNRSLAAVPQTRIQGANHRGILRNPAFANLSSRNPATRSLAQSTFRGNFAESGYARHFDQEHHHHDTFGFVLGLVGPVFWPYAYDDFIDYTFWPYAYDTFWPYAFDDVYEGIYGAYAPEYYAYVGDAAYGGNAYAYAGKPASAAAYRRRMTTAASSGASSRICTGQAQGLTDFPLERIAEQVQPNQDQQHLLGDLKAATAKAVDILQAACPTDLLSTPTGRLDAMRQRVDAMVQAVQMVQSPLETFYQSLSDEQKERFNALDEGNETTNQPDIARLCGRSGSQVASLSMQQIKRSLSLSDAQDAALGELNDAEAKAADLLKTDCTAQQALTPTGRLAAMEQRLEGMLQALDTVQALAKFYDSLSDEQRARVDRLSGNPA